MLQRWYLRDVDPEAVVKALKTLGANPTPSSGTRTLRAWCGWLELDDLTFARALLQELADPAATLVRSEATSTQAGDEVELSFAFTPVQGPMPRSAFSQHTQRQDNPTKLPNDELVSEFFYETGERYLAENHGPFAEDIHLSPPPGWRPVPAYRGKGGPEAHVHLEGKVHDGHRLAFELRIRGLLVEREPPDLSLWQQRLLRRHGLKSADDTAHPAHSDYQAAFLRLTRKQRSATPPEPGVHAYKLTMPGHWVLGRTEAEALGGLGVPSVEGSELEVTTGEQA